MRRRERLALGKYLQRIQSAPSGTERAEHPQQFGIDRKIAVAFAKVANVHDSNAQPAPPQHVDTVPSGLGQCPFQARAQRQVIERLAWIEQHR
jgi:hypothetical protein